jgi:hypothetical protein
LSAVIKQYQAPAIACIWLQMHQALLELKSTEAATEVLSEKVAALDAILNIHRPPGRNTHSGNVDSDSATLKMLHETFTFRLPGSDSALSSPAVHAERLLPALHAIFGESVCLTTQQGPN